MRNITNNTTEYGTTNTGFAQDVHNTTINILTTNTFVDLCKNASGKNVKGYTLNASECKQKGLTFLAIDKMEIFTDNCIVRVYRDFAENFQAEELKESLNGEYPSADFKTVCYCNYEIGIENRHYNYIVKVARNDITIPLDDIPHLRGGSTELYDYIYSLTSNN